jgi:hypothetical protein
MPPRETPETRSVTLVDIPLVKRLADKGIILESELIYTRDGSTSTALSSFLLPQRGLHTMLAKVDKYSVVGQFRLRSDNPNAQIVYIAPGLDDVEEDSAWLHMFDAMAREAGKYHAHALIAEVDEDSSLFETMRTAGFAVYARQQVWRRMPGELPEAADVVELAEQTGDDWLGIQALFASTVPRLVQQISMPFENSANGFVYRVQERVEAYVTVAEGRQGVYLVPYIHPDVSRQAGAIFHAVLLSITRTKPVYLCVRRHQDWLGWALEDLGFEPGARQAVMVRHITAGVRYPKFALATEYELGLLPRKAKQPTKPLRNIAEPVMFDRQE